MRLIRLLTVGKSWLLVKSEPNRYRDIRQNLIPNLRRVDLETRVDTKSSSAVNSAIESAVPITMTRGRAARHDASGEPGPSYAAKLWSKLLHPFSSTSSPVRNRQPLRGGARLDAVRVVRNDLTETDLELVRVSTHTSRERTGAKPDSLGAAARKVASLSKFAGQLFEVGRSRH